MSMGLVHARSRYRLGLLAASLLASVGLAAVQAQNPASAAAETRIVNSACTSKTDKLRWNGGLPDGVGISPKPWPRGRVVLCYTKYRILDEDPNADYYKVVATASYTLTKGARSYPANLNQVIVSSRSAKNNVYGATKGFTSKKACSSPFSLSFSVGPFGVSTSPKVCDGYKATRHIFEPDQAYWRAAKAGGFPRLRTAFAQKVGQGVKPKFDVLFAIPRYENKWNNAGGYWVSKKHVVWKTFLDR